MSNAPPGWYPDPDVVGGTRYWNGSAWTKHRTRPEATGTLRTIGRWIGVALAAGAMVAFAVALIAGGTSDGGDSGSSSSPAATEASASTTTTSSTTTTKMASPKQQIASLFQAQFGGQFKNADITKQTFGPDRGSYFVIATYDEDENTTTDATKLAMWNEMQDAYQALYSNPDLNVSDAKITANVKLVDKLGRGSWGLGWQSEMTAERAQRVDWGNVQEFGLIPWATALERPDLRSAFPSG